MKNIMLFVGVLCFSLINFRAYAASLQINAPVKLTVVKEIRSGRSKKGSKAEFVVSENVVDYSGQILIKKGTPAFGTVINSRHAGAWGRRGILEVALGNTTSIDGHNVPLRATAERKGAAIKQYVHLAAWMLAWPAAMVKGQNVVIKAGTELTAFVDSNVEVAAQSKSTPRPYQTAQIIELNDGSRFFGKVVKSTNDTYVVATKQGTFNIPRTEISSIKDS